MSEDLKIQIFEGINDDPLPPSPVGKCNSDYFVEKFNALVERVEEKENSGEFLLDTNKTYYFDSITGSDEAGDGTLASPWGSLNGLISWLNLGNKKIHGDVVLELRLNGIFDIESFRFDKLQFSHAGSGEIYVRSKSNQINFVLQIDSAQLYCNKHSKIRIEKCDLLIRSTSFLDCDCGFELNFCKIYLLTNTAQLIIKGGTFFSLKSSVINTDFGKSAIVCEPGSFIDISETFNEYKTTVASGFLIEFLRGATCYLTGGQLDGNQSSVTKTNRFFFARGSIIFCESAEELEEFNGVFEFGFNFLDLRFNDISGTAASIAETLNNLSGESRLKIEAIAGHEALRELSAIEVRNKLLELSGEDRLSATAIRDLNYLQYYSSLTEEFEQPAIGAILTIRVGSTNWVQASQHIFIQGGGIYEIVSVISSEELSIKNNGEIINVSVGTKIASEAKITLSARPGYKGYTNTTSIFQQPPVGDTVVVQFEDDSAFYVGSVVYIENADYFGISSINRSTHIAECVRLGYVLSIGVGTNIAIGSRVILAGLRGEKGDYPTASVTENFNMPEIGKSCSISMSEVSFMNIGSTIHIEQVGFFRILDIGNRTLEILNLGAVGNLPAGTLIYAPKQVILSGSVGLNSYSKVWETSSIDSTFGIFCDSVDWCYIGQKIRIGNFGIFEILNVIAAGNALTLKNEESSLNGQIIQVGTPILSLGASGDKGEPGNNYVELTNSLIISGKIGSVFEFETQKPSFFYEGEYITFEGAKEIFVVKEILENTIQIYCISGRIEEELIIAANSKIYASSVPSLKSILVNKFVQPRINYTTTIQTYQSTVDFSIGEYCSCSTEADGFIGYYLVVDKTINSLTLKNFYHERNIIEDGNLVGEEDGGCRLRLLDERPFTRVYKTRSEFIQPLKNQTVEVSFYNFEFLVLGDILKSPQNGYYETVSIDSSTGRVWLLNLGYNSFNEKPAGELIMADSLFYREPLRGETTYNGNHTFLIEDFVMPAVEGEVYIEVQNAEWIFAGMFLFIESAGCSFKVLEKISDNIVKVKNMSREMNNLKSAGETIFSGVNISTGTFSNDLAREKYLQNVIASRNYALSIGNSY